MDRINVGCGDVPTPGWINYDNSLTVRLAGLPLLTDFLGAIGLLSAKQLRFVETVRQKKIRYANAVNTIPHQDNSVDVLYTCHMLEHLDRQEAQQFLCEARRVLISGGIIRVAIPDLRFHVDQYLSDEDSDKFIENIFMSSPHTAGVIAKLRYLMIGARHHLWMYDGKSLCRLLMKAGFVEPTILSPGETRIPQPGMLDLAERSPESLFVEALNP